MNRHDTSEPRAQVGDNFLVDLAARIRAEHEAVHLSARSTLDHAFRAGEFLLQAKRLLGHGQLTDWVHDHCDIAERTAQKYMQLARNPMVLEAAKAPATADLTIDQTLKRLTKAKTVDLPAGEWSEVASGETTAVQTHDGREARHRLPKSGTKFIPTTDQVSWAHWTWNPVTGCEHNCPYCYARVLAHLHEFTFGFEPTFYEYRLAAPRNTKLPPEVDVDPRKGRVFVCSMADLFGKWVPDPWIQKIFAACIDDQRWEYLFLTKFPQRYVGLQLPPTAWVGTTVDEQYRVKIAEEAFRKIKSVRVKWLSLEPLLAPLEFSDLSMFDWIVIGSQSATNQPNGYVPEFAPPFQWVARLTAQAHQAGCKVYQKPNLLGRTDPQHAGMKLIQEAPVLPPLPAWKGGVS